ncbi:MAG: tRNA (adenosine(37)-N6)-dimethylallyltransferase MiaA [Deltaproteobacteria bacterium HGW-Deltaproteobacteria-13]|jgi:tRNA dimethylallyltransferase|nr:MAG: tRNA (adenosine(37)-N6)-dimethylallyltransferase MiaA [Deltaproteobacteria bacterium HGW-Deltaproteobacteria-13]
MAEKLIVILGPTASGKTRLAAQLAYDLHGEIISADSRQVYKNMNIGTGKDLNQYIVHGRQIPYHLIDVLEPQNEFNLFEFQSRFYMIFGDLTEKKILPVLVGGTGLYLESVLKEYDMPPSPINEECRSNLSGKTKEELQQILRALKPCLHNNTDLEDSGRLIRAIEIEQARSIKNKDQQKKPQIDAMVFGIKWERAALRQRIKIRLEERLAEGMVREVADLHSAGLSWEKLESFGLEYRFISQYLQDKITFEEMKKGLTIAIGQFAKRQETWFRRMEKKGVLINWLQSDDYPLLKESVMKFLR